MTRRGPTQPLARPSRSLTPRAPRRPVATCLHGRRLVDPYAYLRDPDDPGTRDYITAEMRYFSSVSRPLREACEALYQEICARNPQDDVSVPERVEGYWYYTRLAAGREYPLHCRRRERMGNPEEVYLDENVLAAGKDYFDLIAMGICPAHRRLAYLVDESGDETYRLLIRDLESGKEVQVAGDAGDSLAWCEDGRTLVYTRVDANGRPHAVYRHLTGGSVEDQVLLEDSDDAYCLSVWKSRSRRYIFFESTSHTTSEIHFCPATDVSNPKRFRRRELDIEYYVDHHDSGFLVLTNKGARNFQLLRTAGDRLDPDAWEVLVPEDPMVTLEYVEPYAGHLLVGELVDGNERLRIIDPVSGASRYLEFPEPCYSIDVEDLHDYHADYVRVDYSSLVSPPTVFDFRISDGQRQERKRDAVHGYSPDRYTSRRLSVEAADGTAVPMSLLYRGELGRGAGRPCLMLAYGAYGESMAAAYDSDLISLVDRDVVVALAHVRGGGECGPRWHDGGRLRNKLNSFDDFLACAHYLVEHQYTSAGQIAAWGASAGGLLAAVAARREPALFSSVIAEVPFVDLVNTLLDHELPLTANDLQEFGDPAVAEDFDRLVSYAPYENVDGNGMPPLLVTAGLHDQRVGFWEPLKWVARMRAAGEDRSPIWLKLDNAGHHGESGRYHQHRHTALVFAFLLANWAIPWRAPASREGGGDS